VVKRERLEKQKPLKMAEKCGFVVGKTDFCGKRFIKQNDLILL
jgi:hypothetical protein